MVSPAIPRGARFTQGDLTKAIKGARAAGFEPRRIVIDINGQIILSSSQTENDDHSPNPWDDVLQ